MTNGFNPLQAFNLQGQTAAVTGGGNGIGKAVALGLARSGAHVVVMDLELSAAKMVVNEIVSEGLSAHAVFVDVKDEVQVDQAMKQAFEYHQRLDILINNAGIVIRKPSTELALVDWNPCLGGQPNRCIFMRTKCCTLHDRARQWRHCEYSLHHGVVGRWFVSQYLIPIYQGSHC